MSKRKSPDIDVFLSYAQQDDEVSSKVEGPGWVSRFGKALEFSLERQFGRPARVWRNNQLQPDSNWEDEIQNAIRNAKVLVAIITPAYVRSDKSSKDPGFQKELEMFSRFNEDAYTSTPIRVFPVLAQPTPLELIPAPLQGVHHFDFTSVSSEAESGGDEFLYRVEELARAVSLTLNELSGYSETPDIADESEKSEEPGPVPDTSDITPPGNATGEAPPGVDSGNGHPDQSQQSSDTRPVWLCQYRRSKMTSLESRMQPGLREEWRITPFKPEDLQEQMNTGDEVILWRTIDEVKFEAEDKSRGGIVGWGVVESTNHIATEQLIAISLTHSFPDKPISRDEILEALGRAKSNWPGEVSLKRLDQDEEKVLLRSRPPPPVQSFHETNLSSDRAETTQDRLGRAPLAFTLAHHINRIWTEQTEPVKEVNKKNLPDEAAFIMHIDSPWGGGKTTFANFVSRILNPSAYKIKNDKPDEQANSFASFVSRILNPGAYEIKNDKPDEQENFLFKDLRLDDKEYWPKKYKDRKWITVMFNAWQHQHINPPWWNFYESIRKQCLEALSFRERYNHRISEWLWRVWSPDIRRTLAVTSLFLFLAFFLWNDESVNSLELELPGDQTASQENAKSNNESVKSAELELPSDQTASQESAKNIVLLLLLTLGGGSGIAFARSFQSGVRKIIDSAGSSTDETTLGTSDPLQRFRRHFSKEIKSYNRPVMVIVDDLDRCEPKYVVELVRGMLTIFRSPQVIFVLLGDKSWIETSFSVVHSDMNSSHKDRNISFGGRFVEKAIQLSFILPRPDEVSRNAYIDNLLDGSNAGKAQDHQTWELSQGKPASGQLTQKELLTRVQSFRTQTKEDFRTAKTGPEREAVMAAARTTVQDQFGDFKYARIEAEQLINDEAVLRAASSERTEAEIRHGISEVKKELPDNPRRIKRIINMIAVYQASAQSCLGIDPGTNQWKQLVLWVILMSEHPSCWEVLCSHPNLADEVINGKTGRDNQSQSIEKPESDLLATLNQPSVANLIKGSAFLNETVQLNSKAVRRLSCLTPLA